jgi:POT family proton-dependent oligopeptide transporter
MMNILGLPNSLLALFIFKACERFSYFAVKSNVLNFLISPEGYNFTTSEATVFLSGYLGYSFLATILIGILCDFIGQRAGLLIGAVMVVVGHGLMHVHNLTVFSVAFCLIILASGFLRSSVIALTNKICLDTPELNIDYVMSQFYRIFNLGVLLGQITFGYVAMYLSWKIAFLYAFSVALFGNCIGILFNRDMFKASNFIAETKKVNKTTTESTKEKTNVLSKLNNFKNIKTWMGILLFFLSSTNLIFYYALETMDSSLLPGWISNYGTPCVFGLRLTVSSILAINPLCVITLTSLIARLRMWFIARGMFSCTFKWYNISTAFMFISTFSLYLMQLEREIFGLTTLLFPVLYVTCLVLSEIIFLPAYLSAPSRYIAPRLYGTMLCAVPIFGAAAVKLSGFYTVKTLKSGDMNYVIIMLISIGTIVVITNAIASQINKKYFPETLKHN